MTENHRFALSAITGITGNNGHRVGFSKCAHVILGLDAGPPVSPGIVNFLKSDKTAVIGQRECYRK